MFKTRSCELEIIDTGDYTAEEYECCLAELRNINRFLGDTRALRKSLLREIEKENLKEFSVLDVGAGSGELLRAIADFARQRNAKTNLLGLELNARSAQATLEESKDYAEISAIRGDALNLPFKDSSFDYSICSLFTHHFTDENVVRILSEMQRVSRKKILVIDLHRHRIAYYFYTIAARIFSKNRLIKNDGALSILRSFKPHELKKLGIEAGLKNVSMKRCFPYRLILQGI
ncbi:MAG: methyltransferase domain-containing protein [Pyrinomonadaceae bacterium]